jgi:hypothetical protein
MADLDAARAHADKMRRADVTAFIGTLTISKLQIMDAALNADDNPDHLRNIWVRVKGMLQELEQAASCTPKGDPRLCEILFNVSLDTIEQVDCPLLEGQYDLVKKIESTLGKTLRWACDETTDYLTDLKTDSTGKRRLHSLDVTISHHQVLRLEKMIVADCCVRGEPPKVDVPDAKAS